jgi:phage-related protein
MSLETFPDIGTPDWGLSVEPDASITTVTLGDGYEVRQATGINHLKDSWSPQWTSITDSQALSTYSWLRARLKLRAFLWVDPEGVAKQVVCTSVRITYNQYNDMGVAATFKQDFNPI